MDSLSKWERLHFVYTGNYSRSVFSCVFSIVCVPCIHMCLYQYASMRAEGGWRVPLSHCMPYSLETGLPLNLQLGQKNPVTLLFVSTYVAKPGCFLALPHVCWHTNVYLHA